MQTTERTKLRKLRVYIGERRSLPESTLYSCLTFPILVRKTRNYRNEKFRAARFLVRGLAYRFAYYVLYSTIKDCQYPKPASRSHEPKPGGCVDG
jgi:hypothetical protein